MLKAQAPAQASQSRNAAAQPQQSVRLIGTGHSRPDNGSGDPEGDELTYPIESSPGVVQQRRILDGIRSSPRMAAQRAQVESLFGATAQRRERSALPQQSARPTGAGPAPAGNGSGALAQSELTNLIESSPGVMQLRQTLDSVRSSPRVTAQRAQLESLFGGTAQRSAGEASPGEREPARLVQRRIHKLGSKGWRPGEKKREGTKPFPDIESTAKGSFFNDVTGVVKSTKAEAAETLGDLLIKSGQLENIATKETFKEWTELGSILKKEFEQEGKNSLILEDWRKILADPDKSAQHAKAQEVLSKHTDPLAQLGSITFGLDEVWVWKPKLLEDRVDHERISGFLKSFMGANGQLDYIRRQPWFLNGTYGIEIEVNFYPHRGFESQGGGYHKDTGGNNIFVNLIFHNDDPIPATELFPDAAPRSKQRRDLQSKLLPKKHRKELQGLRRSLRAKQPRPVEGGVVGRHGYASWVDDLIWHATPDFKNRPALHKDALMGFYSSRDSSYEAKTTFTGRTFNIWKNVIRALAEFPDTAIAQHLTANKLNLKNLDDKEWGKLWKSLYVDDGPDALKKDLSKVPEETLRFDRFLSIQNEAIALDDTLPFDRAGKEKIKGQQITEQPVGLATRRRADSDPQKQAEVTEAQKKQDQDRKTRSFLRTWVKIVRISK